MVYSDFDLRHAVESFGLQEDRDTDLFPDVQPLTPSEFVRVWLDEFAPVALGVNSEPARSAFIITPILVEVRRRSVGPVNVLPGVTLDVDKGQGLSGRCDFLIARSLEFYYLRGPLIAVVEAKREDIVGGLGQCAASMLAIRMFNEKDHSEVPAVYGCVTNGTNWRFLRLEGNRLTIDRQEYYLREVGKIIGIFIHLIGTGVKG